MSDRLMQEDANCEGGIMRVVIGLIGLFGLLVSAGCQPKAVITNETMEHETSTAVTQVPDSATQPVATLIKPHAPINNPPEWISPTAAITPVTGEVSAGLMDAILKDLAGRTGVAVEDISVIQAQSIVWNDGSLGCPQPGMSYTQSIVPGYWVVLDVDGVQYDYRETTRGYFSLCEAGIPPDSPGGTPDT